MYVILCIDVHVHLSAAHHKTTSLSVVHRGSIAQLCVEHVFGYSDFIASRFPASEFQLMLRNGLGSGQAPLSLVIRRKMCLL